MSLLDDYEELCNAQDISIFKGVLDEVLRPIIIQSEERYIRLNNRLGDLDIEIMNLRGEMESRLTGMENRVEHELNYVYDTHNTKLHNVWGDVLKLQNEIETIKSMI